MYKRYNFVSFSKEGILDLPKCIKNLKPNEQIIFRKQEGSLEEQGRIFCIVWGTKESIVYYFSINDELIHKTIFYPDHPMSSVFREQFLELITRITFPYYVEVFSNKTETDKKHFLA